MISIVNTECHVPKTFSDLANIAAWGRLGLYWSHRRKWEDNDEMGGCILPLDQALDYIASNSIFWIWT